MCPSSRRFFPPGQPVAKAWPGEWKFMTPIFSASKHMHVLYIFHSPVCGGRQQSCFSARVCVCCRKVASLLSVPISLGWCRSSQSLCVRRAAMQLKNGTFCIIEQERGGNSSGAPIFVVAVVFLSFMFLALALLCSGESFFDQLYSRNTLFFIFFLPLVSYERTLCEGKVITFWFARGL
jgi:hypothetical protein